MFYQPVLRVLKNAQSQGHITMILSSSPDFLVKPIAEKLQVLHSAGTSYNLDSEGNFNTVLQIMDGSAKRVFLQRFMDGQIISQDGVDVYSDSFHDLPLFEIATKPIAVRPDAKLRRICLERNWEIMT